MMRHVLGLMGVVAAGILLAVSAAMNYRFGFSLGKTAVDGQIYGLASAAADCFKALVPFFFFAALRNRMWSQALAAALPDSEAVTVPAAGHTVQGDNPRGLAEALDPFLRRVLSPG